jgi:hypothetical protein
VEEEEDVIFFFRVLFCLLASVFAAGQSDGECQRRMSEDRRQTKTKKKVSRTDRSGEWPPGVDLKRSGQIRFSTSMNKIIFY